MSAQHRGDCCSELYRQPVDISLKIEHIILEDFLRAQAIIFTGDVRVKIPEFLCLLGHSFLDFVDFHIDFHSKFFKITSDLFFIYYIAVWLGGDHLHSLKQGSIIRERPVPDDSIFIALLDLLDLDEVFRIERLL